MVFQEHVKALYLMKQSLAVIQPVHRNNQLVILSITAPQFLHMLQNRGIHRCVMVLVVIDTHRENADISLVVPLHYTVHLYLQLQPPGYGIRKMPHVIGGMETYQVGTEQPSEQLITFRQHFEQLIRWERHMMKVSNPDFAYPVSKHLGQQHQLIILHPDQIPRPDYLLCRLKKQLINLLVYNPVSLIVLHEREKIVEQRPQNTVRITLVVLINLISRQIYRMKVLRLQYLAQLVFYPRLFYVHPCPANPMLLSIF